MPAVEWTTDEQKAFLQDELVMFKQIGGRKYTKQWSFLFQKWFQRWPERSTALPGIPADAILTEQQKDILSDAVLQRQKQLRHWMHWHAGAGRSHAANNRTAKFISNFLKQKTRAKKPHEVYSKAFFKTHIQPVIGSGMSIVDINKKVREMFESESPDVKEQVLKMTEEQNEVAKRRRGMSKGTTRGDSDGSDSDTNGGVEMDPDVLRT